MPAVRASRLRTKILCILCIHVNKSTKKHKNMDEQDRQDYRDGTLLQGLQPIYCIPLIIKDLIRISRLQFPHYIPLFEKESIGPSRTLADRSAEDQS